jgi:hypothetical protein
MPYANARIYDLALSDFNTNAKASATKKSNGKLHQQTFNNHHFAVMDPTQEHWQNIVANFSKGMSDLGFSSVFLDQVAAAGPVEDMDKSHNHPLAGGHWWRDGYDEMLTKVYKSIPDDKFVATEGMCDFIIDKVDGFSLIGVQANNLVPA